MDQCASPGLLDFHAALTQLTQHVPLLCGEESVELSDLLGRITAQAIVSPINVPAFDNSAMDGYAFNAASLEGDTLTIRGSVLAGDYDDLPLQPGECVRIMTGAPIPPNADTVVMQENTEASGNVVRILKHKAGSNIRRAGEDIKQGETAIPVGHQLKTADIGRLASLGIASAMVRTRLKVALLSTGDELTQPGTPLAPGAIYDSNRFALHAMLSKLPIELFDLGVIKDDYHAIHDAYVHASELADIIICSGGVSVGDADYTKTVLDELGKVAFWKLAMKPGKPFAYGPIGDSHFIGLPGNPVSAIVTFYQLAMPMLASAMGWERPSPTSVKVKAGCAIRKSPGRTDFQRGILGCDEDGNPVVTTTGAQGSGVFSSLSDANCFIVLERERGAVAKGERVNVEMFRAPLV
ncbi:gephyrin-like molybdotransferase Glp [Aliagarivorans taiwanensis]|uniref:molybdopterin molybdotransferase MoeA n=1 Tax=Aliagarivorans taiwanensis TaxID=561966 RepID=UPI00041F3FBD|nr:gephyrin-like molybdotransferase Glp [Aliagarivorans taiwanensis]